MAQIVNQFSFVLFVAVPALIAALFFLLRGSGSRAKQVAAVALLALTVIGFLLLQPGRGGAGNAVAEGALFESGKPLLIEVYSNF